MSARPQQQAIPFQLGTRQRFQDIAQITPVLGQQSTPFLLPQVGYLSHIVLQFVGTVNMSVGGGTFADLGPWSLFNRIKLDTNQGAASIIDVSGYGAYLTQFLLERGYGADRFGSGGGPAGSSQLVPDPDLFVAPLANGANSWVITLIIPVCAGFGKDFQLGLINLQAPETRLNLTVTMGVSADFVTGATATLTGAPVINVGYLYYEVPPPGRVVLPPLTVMRLLEDVVPITGLGDNTYTVLRQGTLLQMIHYHQINGARSNLIDFYALKVNITDTVYRIRRPMWRAIQRVYHGVDWPLGTMCWDFWHAESNVSAGMGRDALDTQAVTTLQSILTVNGGAVLGANNNFIRTVRRVFQKLGR